VLRPQLVGQFEGQQAAEAVPEEGKGHIEVRRYR
jgi:hypothetical protein